MPTQNKKRKRKHRNISRASLLSINSSNSTFTCNTSGLSGPAARVIPGRYCLSQYPRPAGGTSILVLTWPRVYTRGNGSASVSGCTKMGYYAHLFYESFFSATRALFRLSFFCWREASTAVWVKHADQQGE